MQLPPRQSAAGSPAGETAEVHPPPPRTLRRRWAHFIKQVYEADPLLCSRFAGQMGIIAFIDQPEVNEKILIHLGVWPAIADEPPGWAAA